MKLKWALTIVGMLVIFEGPDMDGKRKIGKEIFMKHSIKKTEREVI